MDHTGQSHWSHCGHIPHHIWCVDASYPHCCPHIPLVHESVVCGSIEEDGSLGGSLVRTQEGLQAGSGARHPQNLLVAHTVITHHHICGCGTVLVLDWVQILLGGPPLCVICNNYIIWHRFVRPVGCFGWSKAISMPQNQPFDHPILHTYWDCGTITKNASDTTVLMSVLLQNVQICTTINNPRLYDALFRVFDIYKASWQAQETTSQTKVLCTRSFIKNVK